MSKVQNIIEEIKGLSLLEASELVKGIEQAFGVSAAAAAVAAAPAAGGGGAAAAAAPAEEKTEFNVVLTAVGGNKIGVIKARPAAVKGRYVKRITVATTMSPGVDLDLVALDAK